MGHFRINRTHELGARKNSWPTLWHDVKVYVKTSNPYLALKTICYEPYKKPEVTTNLNSFLKKSFNKLGNQLASINWLEKRDI